MAKRTLIKLTDGLAHAVVRPGKPLDQREFPRWKGKSPERLGRASGKQNPSVKTCRFEEKKRTGCAVELDFLSERDAARLGTTAGPTLRLCTKPKAPGLHIPVASPREAAAIAKQYCDCVGESKGKRAACASNVGKSR